MIYVPLEQELRGLGEIGGGFLAVGGGFGGAALLTDGVFCVCKLGECWLVASGEARVWTVFLWRVGDGRTLSSSWKLIDLFNKND